MKMDEILDQSEDMEDDFRLTNKNLENFLPNNQILEKNSNISNSFQILRNNFDPDVTNTIHPNDPIYLSTCQQSIIRMIHQVNLALYMLR